MKTQSTTRRIVHFALLMVLALGLAAQLHAQAKNLDKTGRALEGYDPVAFFTENIPVKGNPNISSKVDETTY